MSHHHEKRTQFFYEPDPLICHKKASFASLPYSTTCVEKEHYAKCILLPHFRAEQRCGIR